ncbi:zinc finger protein 2-like, partial [Nilaparvata lugens]|uniref:zinc finger protein 2-like n=1 Tax=Nilaparvata lugens TaxID=108931 RepID=UPI00193E804B
LKEKLGDNLEEDNDDVESTNFLEVDDKEEEDHSASDETTTRHAVKKIALKIHWETVHVGEDTRQKLAAENSRDDLETVAGKKGLSTRQYFKCTLCGKRYQSLNSLNRHIPICKRTSVIELFVPNLEHDKDKDGVVEFVDVGALDVEVVVGVVEGEGKGEEVDLGLGKDPEKTGCGERFECSTCRKKFKLRIQLVKHERSCHREEVAIESREKRQTAGEDEQALIAKHIEYVKINSHCCRHCNFRSSEREDIVQHNKTSDCKKIAPAVEGVYACRKCDFSSRSREDLEEHLLVNFCKRFACVVCGSRFRKRVQLIIHYGYHTGVEYKCPVCDKGFYKLDSMKVHQRLHTGEKPHQCELCQKRFATSSLLRVHERIHTGYKPYECAYCDRSFTGKTSRDRHQRIHTGEKPFACKYCGKPYSENSYCVRHERKCNATHPYEHKQGGRVSNQVNVPVRKELNEQCGRVLNPSNVPIRKEVNNQGGRVLNRLNAPVRNQVVSNVRDVRKERGGDTAESTSNELELQHSDDVKLVPEIEELFKCISCFEEFNTLAQLVDHERDEHYKCKTCGKSYSDMEFLLLHEKLHPFVRDTDKLHPFVTDDDEFETSSVPDNPFPDEEEFETSFVTDNPFPDEEFETSSVPDKPLPNGDRLSQSIPKNGERKNCKDSSQNRIECNTFESLSGAR